MIINGKVETLPEAPAIPGLVFRGFKGPQDYPAMTAIINAGNAVDGIEEEESVEETANIYEHLTNCDPYTDLLFAQVRDQPVGYSRVEWRLDAAGNRLYWHEGYLDPAWRRKGIGRALLRWNERRLRAIAAGHDPSTPAYLQVFTADTAVGKNALLEREGYRPARYFHFMKRPSLDDLPEAPLPAGVKLRPVHPEHLRQIWEAKEEAFQDHWGHVPKTEMDFQRWANDPNQNRDLWVIAWDGDRVVGTSLNMIYSQDNARYGFLRGEIHTVGVRSTWRGRGLGRAMIVASLKILREAGMTEAVLGVDSDSLTGALRLYESVGFQIIAKDWIARKPLDPQAGNNEL
jgi:mycothiol synthase